MTTIDRVQPSTGARWGEPGVFHGVPFSDYAALEAINWHTLEPFRRSARAGYRAMSLPKLATATQERGEAFHAAILEPHRFDADYVTMPKFEGHPNSAAHKQAKQAWIEANAAKVALSNDDSSELNAMQAAVRQHPTASQIIAARGKSEITIVWEDPETGLLCKGRIDWLCRIPIGLVDLASPTPSTQTIALVDFKSTRAGTDSDHGKDKSFPDLFNFERKKYAYHGQLAWYADGLQVLQPGVPVPLIVAVQNSNPFDVIVCDLRPVIDSGRAMYRTALGRLIRGRKEKLWPGASDYTVPLTPLYGEADDSGLDATDAEEEGK